MSNAKIILLILASAATICWIAVGIILIFSKLTGG